MLHVRQAKPGEEKKVADLAVQIFKPNMREQFVRLFHVNNIKHIFVAADDEVIVSALNYYQTGMLTSHGQMNVASIGAVCTKDDYRKQGLSSKLLGLAEDSMLKENIDFVIISGRRGLYQRFGARDVGAMLYYNLNQSNDNKKVDLRLFDGHFEVLYHVYNQEDIRYIRAYDEFQDLFLSQTFPDSYQTYHTYVMYEDDLPKAYVIVIDHKDKMSLEVKEMAGSRSHIVSALSALMNLHQKTSVEIYIPYSDKLNHELKELGEQVTQHATLKIISKSSFFDKLNHDFVNKQKKITLKNENDITILEMDMNRYQLNHDETHQLIFSGKIPKRIDQKHHQTIQSVFPIVLPWSHNLNYQ